MARASLSSRNSLCLNRARFPPKNQTFLSTPQPPEGFFEDKDEEAAVLAAQANGKFDLAAVIHKLTIPVLIGTGSHDPNLVSSRVIAATAPNAKRVVLENVGHNSMWEYPALALQTFLDFHESFETG